MKRYDRFEALPLFRYGLIMADPPWKHQNWSSKGCEKSPSKHYRTMPMDEVRALAVRDLAAPDAYLWLWIPGCFLHHMPAVLDAWDATYVTSGFWGKTTKPILKSGRPNPLRPAIGTGYVLREAGEPFVIARWGRPPVVDRGIPSLILAPRHEHSRKPEEADALADRMVPPGTPKLDLFSRQDREGWDAFGDEAGKFG